MSPVTFTTYYNISLSEAMVPGKGKDTPAPFYQGFIHTAKRTFGLSLHALLLERLIVLRIYWRFVADVYTLSTVIGRSL